MASGIEPVGEPREQEHEQWASLVATHVGPAPTRQVAYDMARRAPTGYRQWTSPAEAALDIALLLELQRRTRSPVPGAPVPCRHRFVVRPPLDDDRTGLFRVRRLGDDPVELTALVPLLGSFGLAVVESVPYLLTDGTDLSCRVDDILVHLRADEGTAGGGGGGVGGYDPVTDGPRLARALDAAITGQADVDRLNQLVLTAGLEWRPVAALRAYAHLVGQRSTSARGREVEAALLTHPAVAATLFDYFSVLFDPARPPTVGAASAARSRCAGALERVLEFTHDRALQECLDLVEATLRTSYFVGSSTITLQVDGTAGGGRRWPGVRVETWVHGPDVEGVHLRAGAVARGGIRWSDRAADFRTETLGLMAAQVKKNAVIVPTGAKGGFVCRGLAAPQRDDVERAYGAFIGGLLDVTDNLMGGELVPAPGVRARGGPDPYLVVAPDRGTADLSDLANGISAQRRFWLGDAFASGGSRGYDHKAIGITARGAWLAVVRHFRELGIDVQREPIRVVGVGDMSGDVFGNGMLCSDRLRLVAAFDHRHVFVDPDPDPAASHAERRRLATRAGSSWADYDPDVLSPGGGVWSRTAKVVPLTEPARRVLGIDSAELSPPELVRAVLEAPVDLLWFGGIGTFVRDADEPDSAVGDRTNDEVRVSADRIRARVIAEGGNLAVTQRARVRYSRRGGRVNADFIDNAAGVALSDREVNVKILLAGAVESGRVTMPDRDDRLARAQPDAEAAVLHLVDRRLAALGRVVAESADRFEMLAALIAGLEEDAHLDREAEALPGPDELDVRREAGAGFVRPELAVLLAHATLDLASAIESSPLVRDPSLAQLAAGYFASPALDDLADLVPRHRLHDQIVATELAGELVDRLGVTWARETAAELGRTSVDAAASFWAARQVTAAGRAWEALDACRGELSTDADLHLWRLLERAVSRVARAYLRRHRTIDPAALITDDLPTADRLAGHTPPTLAETIKELAELGIDQQLARHCLDVEARARVVEVAPVARATRRSLSEVLDVLDVLDEVAGTAGMATALRTARPGDRWRSWLALAALDDLSDWRTETTQDVLAGGGEPPAAVARWEAQHRQELEATRRHLASVGAGTDPTTVVALAVRRLPRPQGWRHEVNLRLTGGELTVNQVTPG